MTFALITEGISEHRIIRHILLKYFKDDDPEINQVQPKIIDSKQATPGSWNEVLKYCARTTELKNIFADNDYLVIQIDTDQSQTKPFEISHTKSGNEEKSVDELYNDVAAKLTRLLDPEILETFGSRIFFAICIHTIECWLLPVYYTNNHQSATKGCIPKLNAELGKHNSYSIPTATKEKNSATAIRTYDTMLKNWKRKKEIVEAAQHNDGFKFFIMSLASIAPTEEALDE